MTERGVHRVVGQMRLRLFVRLTICVFAATFGGCDAAPRNLEAIHAYYNYEFTDAREGFRGEAEEVRNEQYILNNLRLGLAAMADGDDLESERVLHRVFDMLSTAGLNKDRTTAAVIFHEGVKIWKGEPFEQALAYHWVATQYALLGDWENARAAAANSIFRLTEFGQDQAADYRAVDSDFALGFLMQAIGASLTDAPGRDDLLDAVVRISPGMQSVADVVRSGDYDTVLLVDFGKGPTKVAYGDDESLSKFVPQERRRGPLIISADGRQLARADAICDVDRMAQDLRWNNLENVRRIKSAAGTVLIGGGAAAAIIGAQHGSNEAMIAGGAAILAGLLAKAGSQADTRYFEFSPQSIYLVPLKVGGECTLDVAVALGAGGYGNGPRMVVPRFRPGEPGKPCAVYLRLHGDGSPQPAWLAATELEHGNDVDGLVPGDSPWIFGGTDVSTPTPELVAMYHEAGHLEGATVDDLELEYRQRGILIGSGAETRPDERKNPSFRHVLEGGVGLFTPRACSMGWKRLMYTAHGPYQPPVPPSK
jgi:hypothetical protein